MNKKPASYDGVAPRGGRPTLDSFSRETYRPPSRPAASTPKLDGPTNPSSQPRQLMSEELHKTEDQFDISFDDLDDIEKEEIEESQKKRWWQRSKKQAVQKKRFSLRKLFKRTALLTSFAVVGFISFTGIRTLLAANSIIDRSGSCPVILCGDESGQSLVGEGDGRVNILLVGVGGEKHDGGDLADTIIVASIDPLAKEAAMLSVPRDLYLEIPGYGSSRVNAAHAYGEQYGYENANYFKDGVGLLQETLEEALDIPIHYYVRVDFEAFRQAVDTVGGVDVNLEEALYDPTFWWEFGVLDLAAGEHTLDGTTALMYVRSRKTSARGDFDRSERQQEVLVSLKDKILSLGTFSDPLKINGLIEAFGSNVRTNIQIPEMLRLYEISEEIPANKIITTSLVEESKNYLSSANIGGASVLLPKTGDFSEIQQFVRSIFVDGFIRDENASIAVLNGSTQLGVATSTTEELATFGYNVTVTADAPTSDFTETKLYDISDGTKPFTKGLLESRFGSTMLSADLLPAGIAYETVDFVIVVGENVQAAAQTQ